MMASQECEEGVSVMVKLLKEATDWSEQETLQKLPHTLPIITDFLQATPPANEGVQVTKFIFGSFLPHLQVDQEAFSLLEKCFVFLTSAIDQLLHQIAKEGKENVDSIRDVLQICVAVCECCVVGVQFLLQVSQVAVSDVSTIPPAAIHILTQTLQHCHNSKEVYGTQVEALSENLSALFRHSVEATLHLANLVPNLTFDSLDDSDMDILIKVCNKMPGIGVLLSGLSEVRGCVVVWRCYSGVIQRYHAFLTTQLSPAPPLAALKKEIITALYLLTSLPSDGTQIMSEKDQKVSQRAIKLASFCMKVVLGLCDKFRGFLDNAHHTLLSLLTTLFRFSGNNNGQVVLADSVRGEVNRQVTIATTPLLLHLRQDEDFIKAVVKKGDKDGEGAEEDESDCCSGYLLLLVALLHPTTPTTSLHANDIIDRIFQCFEKCHGSLSYPLLVDGVVQGGKVQSSVTLYQHVLERLCTITATLTPPQFSHLQESLLMTLLTAQPWTSLLVADLWTFIARYGTSEVCESHCEVLVKIINDCPSISPQRLVLSTLLARLSHKLAPQHHAALSQKLNNTDCGSKVQYMMAQSGTKKTAATDLSRTFLAECTNKMKLILSRSTTDEVVMNLVEDFQESRAMLSSYSRDRDKTDPTLAAFSQTLVKLWKRVPVKHGGSTVVDLLVSGLLEATVPVLHCLNNTQLIQVLSIVKEACQRGSAVVGVGVCSLVAALGPTTLSTTPDFTKLISLIADVLKLVLDSDNPLVYQTALDTFVAFGCHTSHEEVLVEALGGCREEVQESVTRYLQQEPHPTPHTTSTLINTQAALLSPHVPLSDHGGKGDTDSKPHSGSPSDHANISLSNQKSHEESSSQTSNQKSVNDSKPSRESTKCKPNDTSVTGKCFKPIEPKSVPTQPRIDNTKLKRGDSTGETSAKRRREDGTIEPDVGALMESLKESRTVLKTIREARVFVDDCTRRDIKVILEDMMSMIDTTVS